MKSVRDVFFEYAAAFEETYGDDDWERLRPFFAEDAVYEVAGGPYACRIEGCDNILAGMKRSIDGLDRRMDERQISLKGSPEVDGETVRLRWNVGYRRGDSPMGDLPGQSEATVRHGKIVILRDIYDDEELAPFGEWQGTYAPDLDGSYM